MDNAGIVDDRLRRMIDGPSWWGWGMPAKGDDGLPGEKLLALQKRLMLGGRRHYLADLAEELGRSPQAVNRMIDIIDRALGKDAHIERGIDGRRRYFQLSSRSEDKALGFPSEELRYLALCRDLAAPFLPEGAGDRIDRAITALALQSGEPCAHRGDSARIGFHPKGYIDYTPHMATISILRQAISKRQICAVVYTANGREAASGYRYAPGRILAMNNTLYVQGYRLAEGSLLKERPTTFSLHRITSVSPTGEYFKFDADDAQAKAFGLAWHEPKQFRIRIAPQAADYVRDRVWSDDQMIVEHADGSITLSLTSTSEKELRAWIWSFGGVARVIQ